MDLDPAACYRALQARLPGVTLRLAYAGPYDWPAMLDFFGHRAIAGVETVADGRYRRSIEVGGRHGFVDVRPAVRGSALEATIVFPDVRALASIVGRIRRMFDLSADIESIGADLSRDPQLRPIVAARPGLRVPGAWDGFELAVRAILGQQITVGGARELGGRLVGRHGDRLAVDDAPPGLTAVFPGPARLAAADLTTLGLPGARARTITNLAAAVTAEPILLEEGEGLEAAVRRLRLLPGIGEWTAQYIAIRAIREPDAFPAADVGLLRATASSDGVRPKPAELLERAEAWRPWRAYAAQHLWTAGALGPAEPVVSDQDAVA
jgi:AraC family transcriptional regulator of adaptative response / DNA-3-methyladenine glycosylase II